MAWETRRGKIYYYRKRKIGGRVVSEYVGSEQQAIVMVTLQGQRNAERKELSAMRRQARELERELRRASLAILEEAEALAKKDGVIRRRGEWRRI